MNHFAAVIARGGFMSSTGDSVYNPDTMRYENSDGVWVGATAQNYDRTTGAPLPAGTMNTQYAQPLTPLTRDELLQVEQTYKNNPDLINQLTPQDIADIRSRTPDAPYLPPATSPTITPTATMTGGNSFILPPTTPNVGNGGVLRQAATLDTMLNANRDVQSPTTMPVNMAPTMSSGPGAQVLPGINTTATVIDWKKYIPYIIVVALIILALLAARKK